MSEPVFRPAQEADIPEIRRIASAAWAPIFEYFRGAMGDDLYGREHPGNNLEAKADQVESHFRDYGEWAFVTELEGRVVGFCTYRLRDNGVGVIGNNAIDPAYQGQGLGTAQYHEVLRRFRAGGMKYATVHTGLDESHAPARRAYEKAGFRAVRPHVEYYMEL